MKKAKEKGTQGIFARGYPDMKFGQVWSIGLGATFRAIQNIKNYFSRFKDFFWAKPIV